MNKERDQIRIFRQEHLDYIEGLRDTPPLLGALSPSNRRIAERWIASLDAARGVDPYASRPSTASLLKEIEGRDK